MESARSFSVLLVAANRLARDGMRDVIERSGFACAGEASDLVEGVSLAAAIEPDVAVLDVPLRRGHDVQTARRLREASPATRTIVLLPYYSNDAVLSAVLAGASASFVKEVRGAHHLSDVIARVAEGMTGFPPAFADDPGRLLAGRPILTADELRLFELIVDQKTDAEIAAALGPDAPGRAAIPALICRLLQPPLRR
jgi:DNA-binding NarL/FixJ family response regulator